MNLRKLLASVKLVIAILIVGIFVTIAFYVTSIDSLAQSFF